LEEAVVSAGEGSVAAAVSEGLAEADQAEEGQGEGGERQDAESITRGRP